MRALWSASSDSAKLSLSAIVPTQQVHLYGGDPASYGLDGRSGQLRSLPKQSIMLCVGWNGVKS